MRGYRVNTSIEFGDSFSLSLLKTVQCAKLRAEVLRLKIFDSH